jgi:LmbE family N-acetylglucosaminyl deacetylase
MKLFLAPHDDDQILFGCFTLMREKPLTVICTDSFIQSNRGENITAQMRADETIAAMKVLNLPFIRLGIRDDIVDDWALRHALGRFGGFEQIYAPSEQHGNKDHYLVGKVAREIFGDKCIQYSTYAKGEWCTSIGNKIDPTPEEYKLKIKALDCYKSQINLPATKGHFDAAKGASEWYM